VSPRRSELLRTTWALAWPVILSFSIESLVGLCDTVMVGRLGPAAVAAVGVGTQILSGVNVTLFAVGTGSLAVVARHIGAGQVRAAEETVFQAILTAAVLSLAAVVPVLVWAPAIVGAFRVDPAVVAAGAPFVRAVMVAVPASATVFVIATSLRAAGDTRTPLLIGFVVGTLNVALAYALIFGHAGAPALGVLGAGIATAVAFGTGAALGVWLLARGSLRLRLRWPRPLLQVDVVRRILRVGYPAAIEQAMMQVGFFAYIVFASRYGTAAVAAYFIGVRILALSFLPGLGFAAAAGTLVGQYLGAGRPTDAEHGGWTALQLCIALMSAAGMVIFLAAEPIARVFVADPDVVAHAVVFIRVLAVAQPLMAVDYALGGALRGAGDTRFPLWTVLLGFYVCRLGVAWTTTFVLHLGVIWVWSALLGDYAARSVLKTWRFHSGTWKHARV
jgi:putative MATE family efflux protein